MYGRDVTHEEILHGKVAVPESARRLLADLGR
jgi:lipid-binding SYLF domain-containing protein